MPVFPISVNISRVSLHNIHLPELIKELVEKYDVEPKYLQLEITESAYMSNPGLMKTTIDKLHSLGFEIKALNRKEVAFDYLDEGVIDFVLGSSFTVILTAKRMDKKPRRESNTDYASFDLTGIRVLLCEDNAVMVFSPNLYYLAF